MGAREILPICGKCGRRPSQIDTYVYCAQECDPPISADEYVRTEEGTYNRDNGHFLCDDCYVDAGQPSSPIGWVCP